MSKKRTQVAGGDVCVALHTALRKVCDSKVTSAAYNLVHLIDLKPEAFDPWRVYGKLVAVRVNKGEKPIDAAKAAIEDTRDEICELIHYTPKGEPQPKEARTWLYAMTCLFESFDKHDWPRFTAFLDEMISTTPEKGT